MLPIKQYYISAIHQAVVYQCYPASSIIEITDVGVEPMQEVGMDIWGMGIGWRNFISQEKPKIWKTSQKDSQGPVSPSGRILGVFRQSACFRLFLGLAIVLVGKITSGTVLL